MNEIQDNDFNHGAENGNGNENNHEATNGSNGANGANGSNSEEIWQGIGKCKWFNVLKGWGFVTAEDEDATDIFVHQSVLRMPGFRSLGEGESVEFEAKRSGKGWEAIVVRGNEGQTLHGSEIRPLGKNRSRRIRCYNCGEFGHHVASKCKRIPHQKCCYFCKSLDHLVADCPKKPPKSPGDADSAPGSPAQQAPYIGISEDEQQSPGGSGSGSGSGSLSPGNSSSGRNPQLGNGDQAQNDSHQGIPAPSAPLTDSADGAAIGGSSSGLGSSASSES